MDDQNKLRIYAMLLAGTDPELQGEALKFIADPQTAAGLKPCLEEARKRFNENRLPELQRAANALKTLPQEEKKSFLNTISLLIKSDKCYTAREFALYSLLRAELLGPQKGSEQTSLFYFDEVLDELRMLMTAVASAGAVDKAQEETVFKSMMKSFHNGAVLPAEFTPDSLTAALQKLSQLPQSAKESIAQTCRDSVALKDGIKPAEAELVEALALSLGCEATPTLPTAPTAVPVLAVEGFRTEESVSPGHVANETGPEEMNNNPRRKGTMSPGPLMQGISAVEISQYSEQEDSVRLSGQPVILADETQLLPDRNLAGFLFIILGVIFGGMLLREFGRSHELLLFPVLFIIAGLGPIIYGIRFLGERHKLILVPASGLIEERKGLFIGKPVYRYPLHLIECVDFEIKWDTSVRIGGKVQRTEIYEYSLHFKPGAEKPILSLGSNSDFGIALGNAVRIARTANLRLIDHTAGDASRTFVGEELDALKLDESAGVPWWRQRSVLALVVANLVPVVGVLFAGWDVLSVILLFWCENFVIGLYTVLKMSYCGQNTLAEKRSTIPSFILAYGGFCLIHGFLIFGVFNLAMKLSFSPDRFTLANTFDQHDIWLGVVALVISHGYSFAHNYLGEGEYRRSAVAKMFLAPFGRVVVLQIVMLLGGFVVLKTGSPTPFLVLLVSLKIILDVLGHLREHRKVSLREYDKLRPKII